MDIEFIQLIRDGLQNKLIELKKGLKAKDELRFIVTSDAIKSLERVEFFIATHGPIKAVKPVSRPGFGIGWKVTDSSGIIREFFTQIIISQESSENFKDI